MLEERDQGQRQKIKITDDVYILLNTENDRVILLLRELTTNGYLPPQELGVRPKTSEHKHLLREHLVSGFLEFPTRRTLEKVIAFVTTHATGDSLMDDGIIVGQEIQRSTQTLSEY